MPDEPADPDPGMTREAAAEILVELVTAIHEVKDDLDLDEETTRRALNSVTRANRRKGELVGPMDVGDPAEQAELPREEAAPDA